MSHNYQFLPSQIKRVAIVQSLSIRRAVRRDNGLTLFVPLLLDCEAKDGRLLREKIASKDTSFIS